MTDPRESLGRLVREVWVDWAREQSDAKPGWLLGWTALDDGQREVDMRIGAAVAESVEGNPAQLAALRREVRQMQLSLERKNRELDALHLVWCSGSCASGVHRWTDEKITGELVETAERNTARLRRWYDGVKWRLEHYTAGQETDLGGYVFRASEWHEGYAARNAAKTDLLPEDAQDA